MKAADVFSVRVPKDFADRTLVWSLRAHGATQKVVESPQTLD